MRHKLLLLILLGGSLATACLGYVLVVDCFADWVGLTHNPLVGGRFWGKALVLLSWLVTAVHFLRNRTNLTRDK